LKAQKGGRSGGDPGAVVAAPSSSCAHATPCALPLGQVWSTHVCEMAAVRLSTAVERQPCSGEHSAQSSGVAKATAKTTASIADRESRLCNAQRCHLKF
jgi:hypothetical protein